ncbi:puromycin-sensitive aminopeptidase-like protein [Ptiloglossa arizonensis]|uniref:puromycin-sensitive aminopeptidase-like protein n=1 Tax=Ptiloglossa arizonensis TaxID=3350558 RepID=UPI003F9F5304
MEEVHMQDKWCVITFLCPTSARRMFPCWDEPLLKATFAIHLVLPHDMSLVGLSNMVSIFQHL